MKKTRFLTVISALALLSGCGAHQHTFSDSWEYDDSIHYHPATCEHTDQRTGSGKHTFGAPYEKEGREFEKCSVCNMEREVDHDADFDDITEFGDDVEIHTTKQKEYLNYPGKYDEMPSNQYPDGSKSISDPEKVLIEWTYNKHKDTTQYSVEFAQTKDFKNSVEIMGTNDEELEIYNLFLGTNYYKINVYNEGSPRISSGIRELTVDETCPRNIYAGPSMTNCRDTGGRTTKTGAKVRQGMLYRTCGSDYSMRNKFMDDEAINILVNELKIKTEINVSDNDTYNFKLDDIVCYDTFCDYANTSNPSRHHFSRNAESVKNVFELLANKDNYPIAYHCRIGTDRTGLIGILVNGLLGVDINEIFQDYLFSNFGAIGEKRYIGTEARDDNIEKYMDEIRALPGEDFQEQVYNALLAIGVPVETLEAVKENLLDGELPDNEADQIVVTADEFELDGTTLKTEEREIIATKDLPNDKKAEGVARQNPVNYCTLVNGSTATAEFDVKLGGSKVIYAYIGHKDSSTSKKISGSIEVVCDETELTVPEQTFQEAGMGKCSDRMNYYFVKIGEVSNMAAGKHSITITGINNEMNLANIVVL